MWQDEERKAVYLTGVGWGYWAGVPYTGVIWPLGHLTSTQAITLSPGTTGHKPVPAHCNPRINCDLLQWLSLRESYLCRMLAANQMVLRVKRNSRAMRFRGERGSLGFGEAPKKNHHDRQLCSRSLTLFKSINPSPTAL